MTWPFLLNVWFHLGDEFDWATVDGIGGGGMGVRGEEDHEKVLTYETKESIPSLCLAGVRGWLVVEVNGHEPFGWPVETEDRVTMADIGAAVPDRYRLVFRKRGPKHDIPRTEPVYL